jgi:hypothetical protein
MTAVLSDATPQFLVRPSSQRIGAATPVRHVVRYAALGPFAIGPKRAAVGGEFMTGQHGALV